MRSLLAVVLLTTGCSTYFVPVNHRFTTHPDIPIDLAKLTLRDSQVVWLSKAHITQDSVVARRADTGKRVAFPVQDVARLEAGRSSRAWDVTVGSLVGGTALFFLLLSAY